MNIAAAVCVFAPALIYAVYSKVTIIKRIGFLESFYRFSYLFCLYAGTTGDEITKLISTITQSENDARLDFAVSVCSDAANGDDLVKAWYRSVNLHCRFLSSGEKGLVNRFISTVNARDSVSQKNAMKLYLAEIDAELKKLHEYEIKNLKPKCAAAVFIGCAAALAVI